MTHASAEHALQAEVDALTRRAEVAEAESREQAGELERLRAELDGARADTMTAEARAERLLRDRADVDARLDEEQREHKSTLLHAQQERLAFEQQLAESEAKCKALETECNGWARKGAEGTAKLLTAEAKIAEATALLSNINQGSIWYARRDAFLSRVPSAADSGAPTAGCHDAITPMTSQTDRQAAVIWMRRAESAESERDKDRFALQCAATDLQSAEAKLAAVRDRLECVRKRTEECDENDPDEARQCVVDIYHMTAPREVSALLATPDAEQKP